MKVEVVILGCRFPGERLHMLLSVLKEKRQGVASHCEGDTLIFIASNVILGDLFGLRCIQPSEN